VFNTVESQRGEPSRTASSRRYAIRPIELRAAIQAIEYGTPKPRQRYGSLSHATGVFLRLERP
jgi:hypothetical protein